MNGIFFVPTHKRFLKDVPHPEFMGNKELNGLPFNSGGFTRHYPFFYRIETLGASDIPRILVREVPRHDQA